MNMDKKIMHLEIRGWNDIPDCEKMNFFLELADLLSKYQLLGVFKE